MTEAIFYLASSFWLGALHAATPGHGKTIAAAYIVGARGRPADALVLGIFVTLSHVSGIVMVALLASLGAAWSVPARIEAYLALIAGLLVVAIGLWMLRAQSATSVRAGRSCWGWASRGASSRIRGRWPFSWPRSRAASWCWGS